MYVDCRGIVYDELSDALNCGSSYFSFTGLDRNKIIETLVTKYKENNYNIDINIIKDIANKCIIIRDAEEVNNIKNITDDFFSIKKPKKETKVNNKQDDEPQLSLF